MMSLSSIFFAFMKILNLALFTHNFVIAIEVRRGLRPKCEANLSATEVRRQMRLKCESSLIGFLRKNSKEVIKNDKLCM